MKCVFNKNEQEEMLLGYTTGALEPETARTYQRHLHSCADCRELVELQTLLDQTLEGWQAPPVSGDFDAKLMARIRLTGEPKSAWRRVLDSMGWGQMGSGMRLATAGGPMLALALGAFLWTSPYSPLAPPAIDQIAAQEIVEVEKTLDDLEALQALHTVEGEQKGAPDAARKLL